MALKKETKKKMTEKEKQDWDRLCLYVKNDILKYPSEMKFPKKLALRLKGLSEGKFMVNNRIKSEGDYSFEIILLTFMTKRFDIEYSIKTKDFKSEDHKINYMMAIVENSINDTVLKLDASKKAKEKLDAIKIENFDNKAEYVRKTRTVKSSKLNKLW